MRTEKDFLGEVNIPENALYGIHALRAKENFPDKTPVHVEWYQALATVKHACYLTAIDFLKKAEEKYPGNKSVTNIADYNKIEMLLEGVKECEKGEHFHHLILPAISGGAGTSFNMNMNEIICNLALLKNNFKPGQYEIIDPAEYANIFQSTNDVIPTSLRVAIMRLLNELEESVNLLHSKAEIAEKKYRNVLRIGYTQMQEAVPTTYGKLFGSYSDALSRDWWRISRCFERIKVVNLGGSAIGTSVAVPKYFVMEVVRTLQKLTDLPVTRGENLTDATSNLDPLVEVHAILKSHAVNLEKMVNDLRLLSSDVASTGEIKIPQLQLGSSIMPGKVNPVVPEFVISVTRKIYANDDIITGLSAQGCLELNAYLPTIGHAFIESLKLLIACNNTMANNLFNSLEVDTAKAENRLFSSPSVTTVLLPYIGYNKSSELAKYMKENNRDIFEANSDLKIMKKEKLKEILKPDNLTGGGFQIKDLINE
ncbi:MAG: hypothetical protein JW894_00865 [Bacteroidales bacterium]|nr:hypothetical protein [Bacteroidales bacterium]